MTAAVVVVYSELQAVLYADSAEYTPQLLLLGTAAVLLLFVDNYSSMYIRIYVLRTGCCLRTYVFCVYLRYV